jgi:signal transduction histidine kinase
MPKLSAFIRANTEPILSEWETFARGLTVEEPLDIAGLRDHAKDMLNVVAEDLDETQTRRQQSDKARGLSDAEDDASPTAAQEHGAGRAGSGFTIAQMVAEFRALRASVIHLWMKREHQATEDDLRDMIRFNEAIDQAIAESTAAYARDVRESKDRFLAILGHDLRTPLGSIITSTRFMLDTGTLAEPNLGLVTRVESSARRMNRLVTDLLEFTRSRFGDAIPVAPADIDLDKVIRDVAAEVAASYPSSRVTVTTSGNLCGRWDCDRIAQALINLLSNAVQHGAPGRPIEVTGAETEAGVSVAIHNEGRPIKPGALKQLFNPAKEVGIADQDRRHFGLGLYIVDKIVKAHDGTIDVESTAESGTTFTVRLPRARA